MNLVNLRKYLEEAISLQQTLLTDEGILNELNSVVELLQQVLLVNGKLLIAGNGGSAADAQHMAAEFVGNYKLERRGFPALALTTDGSTLTSIGNDFGFDDVFARQVEALGQAGDVLVLISTSGCSPNLVQAAKVAQMMDVKVVGLLGKGGGELLGLVDLALVVPSKNTPRIQELHTLLVHIICEEVEKGLLADVREHQQLKSVAEVFDKVEHE